MDELGDLRRQVNEKFGRADIPAERKTEARELLRDGVNLRMFDGDKSARRFLVSELQEKREQFQSDDGDRTEPLCSCPQPYCKIKQGSIPPTVTLSLNDGDTFEDALFEFRRDHNGDTAALVEARKEWEERRTEAIDELRQALTILSQPTTTEDTANAENLR